MTGTQSMTKYDMTEQLAEKMHITLEEARAALEASDWNTLTATHTLELEQFRRMQALREAAETAEAVAAEEPAAEEETAAGQTAWTAAEAAEDAPRSDFRKAGHGFTLKKLGRAVRDLIALGNRNRVAVHRNGEQLLEMPVTALALLMLFSFGTCAFLLVVSLFAGCRYSVNGHTLGAEA